jgi:hypothetical protein
LLAPTSVCNVAHPDMRSLSLTSLRPEPAKPWLTFRTVSVPVLGHLFQENLSDYFLSSQGFLHHCLLSGMGLSPDMETPHEGKECV